MTHRICRPLHLFCRYLAQLLKAGYVDCGHHLLGDAKAVADVAWTPAWRYTKLDRKFVKTMRFAKL